jgi:hypothetical protein
MIVSTITDGFGNQLFMYACGYAMARRNKEKLALDTTYLATSNLRKYELGGLRVEYDKMYSINKSLPYFLKVVLRKAIHACMSLCFKQYREKQAWHYDGELLQTTGSCRLRGYWQSEKYFKDYRSEILKMLSPDYEPTASFKELLAKIQNSNSISVHVRRGDYVALGICLSDVYYKAAIRLMSEKVNAPEFYVFSDDIEYAKGLFDGIKNSNINFVKYEARNATIEDFLLMKSCLHNITANSSYSWWGAWGNENNEKIVVCPKREPKDDFYPEEWIKI